MEEKCYEFINESVEHILVTYTSRYEQNKAFAALHTSLPLVPLKMTLTTAVFLFTDSANKNTVLKRIVVNKTAPIREDEIALRLSHKNVVKTLRSIRRENITRKGEVQEIIWLYMEYLPIRVSQKYVAGKEDTIRSIMKDVLEGLEYLHSLRIAHLDLKIANIMAEEEEGKITYKIIDLGYARKMRKMTEVKIPTKNYGTYPYKPPEIVFDNLHGLKGDIWCVGAIVWFLVCRQTPFYDDKGEKLMKQYKQFLQGVFPPDFPSVVSEECKDFVRKCMKIDRFERPSAEDLLRHPFIISKELTYVSDDSGYSTEEDSSGSGLV